jgi:hypothetical protein
MLRPLARPRPKILIYEEPLTLFTNVLVQEYETQITTPYKLMNHKQFYKWWRPTPQPPELTRQTSFDIALKTCRQIGEQYSKNTILGVKNDEKYDIIIAIDTTLPSSTDEEKLNAISGFLISKYEECKQLVGVYSVNLICTKPLQIQGKFLIGAFLYCIKKSVSKKVILELAGGYHNIAGYFLYSKMGFDKDLDLFEYNCFTDLDVLPMSANVENLTIEEIIGYTNGTLQRDVKDDTHLYDTGKPKNDHQIDVQAEMAYYAQEYYKLQIAEKYGTDEFEHIIQNHGVHITDAMQHVKDKLNELFQSYTRAPGCKRCIGGKRTKRKRKSINRKTKISYGRMHHMF